jgi:hypothetical protein
MNNPFANFDLETSLAGLPNTLRQPMFLAVAASTLAHGLVFLVLPVVTNSAESKKLPDRIVGVVELTPEQQAKLPPSMMVSQFPASAVPLLPTTLGGKLPLTGLFPGMPNPNIPMPTTKNPINALMDSIERDTAIVNSTPYSYTSPSYTPYTPPVKITPTKTEAEKKAEEETTKKAEILAARRRIETEEEAKRQIEEENKKKNQAPGSGVSVAPGQQATTPGGSTPNPPGATDLKKLSPQEQAQRNALAATMVYNPDSVDPKAQEARQKGADQSVLVQLDGQLKQLPEDQQGPIVMAILNPPTVDTIKPIAVQVPPGMNLDFGKFARPTQVEVIVQAYVTPEGKLLPYSVGEGQPLQDGVIVTTTSGNPYLDEQARGFVKEQLAKNPQKGRYQSIKYKVPVIVPPQQAQG